MCCLASPLLLYTTESPTVRATVYGVSGSVCSRSGTMAEAGDQVMIEMHPPGPGNAECAVEMEQEMVMIAACVATHK